MEAEWNDQGGDPVDADATNVCFPSFLQEAPVGSEVIGSFTLPTAGLEGNVNGGRPSCVSWPRERQKGCYISSLSGILSESSLRSWARICEPTSH